MNTMNLNEYKELLSAAFGSNGYPEMLEDAAAEKFYTFSNLLVDTNKRFNLTAITDEKEIMLKHFVDCASIAPHIPKGATLIDIGCGAGFPTIPIAILRKDVQVTALDSTQKRIDFVNLAAKNLNLQNVTGVCARAEEFALTHRETFDVCTSRAVARLNILVDFAISLNKLGGSFIAMKTQKADEEYAEAREGVSKLGCSLILNQQDSFSYQGIDTERKLLVFKKERGTPKEFPRRYSQIIKKPL